MNLGIFYCFSGEEKYKVVVSYLISRAVIYISFYASRYFGSNLIRNINSGLVAGKAKSAYNNLILKSLVFSLLCCGEQKHFLASLHSV